MSQLPLLYKQQRTTTRYCPSGDIKSLAVFRPKLPFLTAGNPTVLAASSSTAQGDGTQQLVSTTEDSIPTVKPNATVGWRATRTHCEPQSLRWIEATEHNERRLIKCMAYSTSPVQCFFIPGDGEDCILPSMCLQHPPTIMKDTKLRRMANVALVKVLERAYDCRWFEEGAGGDTELPTPVVQANEDEDYRPDMMEEFVDARSRARKEFLAQIGLWRSMIDVIQGEKKARIALLGEFISCRPPEPCRCLLWDMEVLEESAIPLEPAVCISCLYVSIVIGGYGMLEKAFLEERERELQAFLYQFRFVTEAYDILNEICDHENRRYGSMMGYHTFMLQLLQQHEAQGRQTAVLEEPSRNLCSAKTKAKFPFFSYYKYLHVVGTVEAEDEIRRWITLREISDFSLILYYYEGVHREDIVAVEGSVRQGLYLDIEAQLRLLIQAAEEEDIRETVRPLQFQKEVAVLWREWQWNWQQDLNDACASRFLEFTCEYQESRRREICVFEHQLRAAYRCVFINTTAGAARIVTGRWMRDGGIRAIEREEAIWRKRLVEMESEALTTWATAHEWLMDYDRNLRRAASERKFVCATERMTAEETTERHTIESLWAHERGVLFEGVIHAPKAIHFFPPAAGGTDGDERRLTCGRRGFDGLDLRQVVTANLGEFFSDRALLGLFGNFPASPLGAAG